MRRCKTTVTLVFALIATHAIAEPTITEINGLVVDNGTVSISGYDFGLKPHAAPILWEDFEAGSPGEDLSQNPEWPPYLTESAFYNDGSYAINGPNYAVTPYNGNLFVSNRTCGPDAPQNEYHNAGFGTNNFHFAPTDTVYYSYMVRWDVYDPSANNYGVAKFGRTNAAPNRYNGAGLLGVSSMNPNSGGGLYALYTPGDGSQINVGYTSSPPRGEWRRHELFKINSTPGQADGTITIEMIRSGNPRQIVHEGNIMTRESGQNFKQTNIILGTMLANIREDGDVMMSIDDVYVDNTRSRVELGDNTDFYACTFREPQIPTYWDDGSITVTINAGRLNPDSPAYLFVVDAAGHVSDPFDVDLLSDGTDPGPPGVCGSIQLLVP